MEAQIIQAFRNFDVNGDGMLTFEELHHVIDTLAFGTVSVEDIVWIFDQMDINQDEAIQYEEFVHWCCNEGAGPVVERVLALATGDEHSFPVSGEQVAWRPDEEQHVHVVNDPCHKEWGGIEGGHRVEHDGAFTDVKYSLGAVHKAKHGHDGSVVETGVAVGIGASITQGVNIGRDRDQQAQLTFGGGQGAGFGMASKAGIDHTGAAVVEASAAGFGFAVSVGGDDLFKVGVKIFGVDLGFKLTLKGLFPKNARERKDLQSTFKWNWRNTMTAAKNYAKGQIKKDKKHRVCTITEWAAFPGSHYTVKVYEVPDDCPASFEMYDGHHEVLYDEDEFIGKDYVEGEFLKVNRKVYNQDGLKPLMSQAGYTEHLSKFTYELADNGMLFLRLEGPYLIVGDDSQVKVGVGPDRATAFTARPVEDGSGRFVLEPETHPGFFIGRSNDSVVKLTNDVGKAQMRAIPVGETKSGLKFFAFRFGG